MINYFRKTFYKIYDYFFPKKYKLTPKGECFFRYLKDKMDGKDVYIEEYERILEESAKNFVCEIKKAELERN